MHKGYACKTYKKKKVECKHICTSFNIFSILCRYIICTFFAKRYKLYVSFILLIAFDTSSLSNQLLNFLIPNAVTTEQGKPSQFLTTQSKWMTDITIEFFNIIYVLEPFEKIV